MGPIEAAVLPLKVEAIQKAEQEAQAIVARITAELDAVGFDRNIAAPYPDYKKVFGNAYKLAAVKYELFCRLTRSERGSHRPSEPCIVAVVPELVETFVEKAKESAAFQYEQFVAKLVTKIGACTTATLEGNHVWSYSFLTITKADAPVEVWKTQTICNVSKYGNPFLQWPSRKVKVAK